MNDPRSQPRKPSTAPRVPAARSSLSTINYQPSTARRAFTFIEVLFAIIILGVGLIMIAGLLPVAIQQGQRSQEDLNGRIVCDNGYALLRAAIDSRSSSAAGPFNGMTIRASPSGVSFMEYGHANGQVFQDTLSERVSQTDPRFAWMPFVQLGRTRVNLLMLGMTRRESEVKGNYLPVTDGIDTQPYFAGDLSGSDFLHNGPASGRAVVIDGEDATTRNDAGIPTSEPTNVDFIVLFNDASAYIYTDGARPGQSKAPLSEVAAEGAFVIIAGYSNERSGLRLDDVSRNTGRVFRLGQNVSGTIWRLDPAYDLPLLGGNAVDTTLYATVANERPVVWMVGRGLRDPAKSYANDNKPLGAAQDLAVERYSFSLR